MIQLIETLQQLSREPVLPACAAPYPASVHGGDGISIRQLPIDRLLLDELADPVKCFGQIVGQVLILQQQGIGPIPGMP